MNPLEAVIFAIELVSSISLGILSVKLLRLQKLLGGSLDAPAGFALLALSQLSGALSIVGQGRLSYTLYVATSALAAAGFASLQTRPRRPPRGTLVAAPIVLPFLADTAAFLVAGAAARRFRGPARVLVALSAISYALRAAGLLLVPSQIGIVAFITGEASRAITLTALSLLYVPR